MSKNILSMVSSRSFMVSCIFFFGCTPQHVGSYFLNQGSNSCPLLWKAESVKTGPPGKSVSCLIFKFLSHFEFIFVYGVTECSNFIDNFKDNYPEYIYICIKNM